MSYNDSGTFIVKAYTAGGALPVPNSVVRVSGADEENAFIEFSLITDVDGMTPRITLPAPAKSDSLTPSPKEIPYSKYNVEITAQGYYPKKINNVALFSGTDTFLPINMVPLAIYEKGVDFPADTLNTTVNENPFL